LFSEKGNKSNESPGIGKENLRQVQGDYAQGCSAGDLRKRKAQAAPGLSKAWQERELPSQGSGVRFEGSDKDAGNGKIELTPET
jgi:hypothetical protein